MGDINWFFKGFPQLVSRGYGPRFEALVEKYPPDETDVSKWKSADVRKMLQILGLSELEPELKEQEFLPESGEESPFGSVDAADLEEVFEDSPAPGDQVKALQVRTY
jgi:hypothetical protein